MTDIREIRLKIGKSDELPESIHGCVGLNNNEHDSESYIVLINANRSPKDQEEAFLHECLHIWRNHLSGEYENVDQIEAETHRRMNEVKTALAL